MTARTARNGTTLLLAACLLGSSTGCFSARTHAERKARKIEKGMDKRQVRKKLGRPRETLEVPGQGDHPDLPVELWTYGYDHTFWMTLTIVFTFGLGLIFMDMDRYSFKVGFGRHGRVVQITPVRPPR